MALLCFLLVSPPKVDINLISFFEQCITDYLYTGSKSSCEGQLNNYLGLGGFAPDCRNTEACRWGLLGSGMSAISQSKSSYGLCSSLGVFFNSNDFSLVCLLVWREWQCRHLIEGG